jgi:hypothetical protein
VPAKRTLMQRHPRHPAEVTSDRLGDHYEKWYSRLSGDEREAISIVRNALERRARASRQAAALYAHWRRKDGTSDGEVAVLAEITDTDGWTHLVCALLTIGCNLITAARDGREDWYLDYVLRQAMLDEVAND